ncbi:MAG: hypothetical protein QW512_03880 [Thermofilaceae archaeon]
MTRRAVKQHYEVVKVLSDFFDKIWLIDHCRDHADDEECKKVPLLITVLSDLESKFDELDVLVRAPKPTDSIYIMRKDNIVAIADASELEAYIYVMRDAERARQLMRIIREIRDLFSGKEIYVWGIHELIADHMDSEHEITDDSFTFRVAVEG